MLYTCTYPLLCKMNFISIIIINVVRGHNGGKQTDIHRVNEKEPFHCIILTHFCEERREICNHFLILLLLYSTQIYYKLFYPRDPNVRAHMHTDILIHSVSIFMLTAPATVAVTMLHAVCVSLCLFAFSAFFPDFYNGYADGICTMLQRKWRENITFWCLAIYLLHSIIEEDPTYNTVLFNNKIVRIQKSNQKHTHTDTIVLCVCVWPTAKASIFESCKFVQVNSISKSHKS